MKWTEDHDIMLCREVLVVQPFQYRPKSAERGNAWTSVACELNKIQEIRFAVSQKAVRDRLKLLIERFKRKMREEETASGICPEESELDQALYSILEIMEEAEQQYDKSANEKQKQVDDRKNAEEFRSRAMETFAESKKRESENEGSQPKPRKKRASGGETLVYLQEKAEKEFEIRKAELEIKKKEIESNKEVQVSLQKQQQQQFMEFQKTMMEQSQQQQAMMQQQMQQQSLHHQQFIASQQQQQQQTSQVILVLLEKLTKS